MGQSGQVAVITGASSGIGAATARELRSMGMRLVITARREERLRQLQQELGETEIVAGDILDPGLPQQLIDRALSAFGRCDVLFNNAGFIEVGPIESIDLDRVCQMIRVNVEAATRVAYTAVRHFRSQNSGFLLSTSSVLGTKVRPTAGAYAATKYAIEALTEALRLELAGTNVRVSCIEPGLVMTELHARWSVHPKDSLDISAPLQAEDIARCIRFLLEQPPHVRIPRMLVVPGEQQL